MERVCSICGRPIGDKPYYNGQNGEIICMVGDCFEQTFWNRMVKFAQMNPDSTVIANGRLYTIGGKNDEPKGYGGEPYRIQRDDGRVIVTNNLWYQGIIPDKYLDTLKNNATFLTGG